MDSSPLVLVLVLVLILVWVWSLFCSWTIHSVSLVSVHQLKTKSAPSVVPPGPQISVQDQDEHRAVPPRHHGADPQARPQVPAGLQRPERHCEYQKDPSSGAGSICSCKVVDIETQSPTKVVCLCCVQICSLMRGGIAERGGVRVGHRIIEINGQSVVATPHEKIVQILSNAMGEVGDFFILFLNFKR